MSEIKYDLQGGNHDLILWLIIHSKKMVKTKVEKIILAFWGLLRINH
nr:MAG TPA: hypothetical protein [Caudoviricetes sp.]